MAYFVLLLIISFFFFSQYVLFNGSNIHIEERTRQSSIPKESPQVEKLVRENVVLYFYENPTNKEYLNVFYHNSQQEKKHFVYGSVFWYQTISIKRGELNTFAQCFNNHIKICRGGSSNRESVNVCDYVKCRSKCGMYTYEDIFLKNQKNISDSSEVIRKIFFNYDEKACIYRHEREKQWEDFFAVLRNKFLDGSGKQIYSEGKKTNSDYTYLYLLTNKNMYELGFCIKTSTLFLFRVNLKQLNAHYKIIAESFQFNIFNKGRYDFQMPFNFLFRTSVKDDMNTPYSSFPSNSMKNGGTEEKQETYHKSEVRKFIKEDPNDFECKLWDDIVGAYENGERYNIDFPFYNRVMPLQ